MDPPIDSDELLAAWRALAELREPSEGWRSIPIGRASAVLARAGRQQPNNTESLLICFGTAAIPNVKKLPQGRGFSVSAVSLPGESRQTWVALSRLSGTQDMFGAMCCDVMNFLGLSQNRSEVAMLSRFVSRIAAWQYFMEHHTTARLSIEAEAGLAAELMFLRNLLQLGVDPASAVEAWHGPTGAVWDFELSTVALEVKASLASAGFPIHISSLDQLDDVAGVSLYVVAVRLIERLGGETLPDVVTSIQNTLIGHPQTCEFFDALILRAGYLPRDAAEYKRRFQSQEERVIEVTDQFPRLIRRSVGPAIVDAQYVLDLDRSAAAPVDLRSVLSAAGIIQWNS